jgi:flagellar basal body-associated protein FliL
MTDWAKRRRDRRRLWTARVVSYLLVVGLCVYGFWRLERQDEQRCEAGEDVRNSITVVVTAVYNLASGLAQPEPGEKRTAAEQQEVTEYLERLEAFRTEALSGLSIPEYCLQYES